MRKKKKKKIIQSYTVFWLQVAKLEMVQRRATKVIKGLKTYLTERLRNSICIV